MVQALFLISMLGGVASLVAAIGVARLYWRSDVPPFGRRTNEFKVLARPEAYAVDPALGVIRALTVIGFGLIGFAIVCVVYQFLVDLGRR